VALIGCREEMNNSRHLYRDKFTEFTIQLWDVLFGGARQAVRPRLSSRCNPAAMKTRPWIGLDWWEKTSQSQHWRLFWHFSRTGARFSEPTWENRTNPTVSNGRWGTVGGLSRGRCWGWSFGSWSSGGLLGFSSRT